MYCAISDIYPHLTLDELLRLVNDENRAAGGVNLADPEDVCAVRITEQITAADYEIDGYLRSLFTLPLSSVPGLIKEISVDLAIYNLYKRRFRLDMPETLTALYNGRVKQLEKIQSGVISLDVTLPSGTETSGEISVNKTAEDRLFNKQILDSH